MIHRILVLSLSFFIFPATGWTADSPFVGTWKVIVAKSTYSPGPPPERPGALRAPCVN